MGWLLARIADRRLLEFFADQLSKAEKTLKHRSRPFEDGVLYGSTRRSNPERDVLAELCVADPSLRERAAEALRIPRSTLQGWVASLKSHGQAVETSAERSRQESDSLL